ncbi:MAG: magnesium transporter [Deltaproteobacteria bacterium]|nr:magnesium transporter [Candidatus Anaeroferrophillus wilburensis]MBN2890117.1 magnesium transporter [Deltaproteobacteria bacterium]
MVDTFRKLIHREAWHNVNKIISKLYPADIAHCMRFLSDDEQYLLFTRITDTDKAAETISELDISVANDILTRLPEEKTIRILKAMSDDDKADILAHLPEEISQQLLGKLGVEESQEIETLLSYRDDTAGGIMTTEFFALPEDLNVAEAIGAIRKRGDEAETVFYIYVVDQREHLVGIVSLRKLILSQPDIKLQQIMNSNVVKVTVATDQELVAQLVEKYNILAIPVVDDENKLVGIVTVDDIIDVIRQEATEDIYRMAGTDSTEIVYADDVWKIARIRLPWLLTTLLGGVVTGYFMWLFKATLHQILALVTFVPVITGMGGNVGTQSSLIIVRGLATGRITLDNLGQTIWREARTGIVMGIICGMVVGIVAYLWHRELILGLVVAVAMSSSMTIAAMMGALAPTVFHRLRIDPAIASGPFVTTSNDIIGILVYMGTATMILRFVP